MKVLLWRNQKNARIPLKANLDLNVKIGAAKLKMIFFCKNIKANSIVAPMVERICFKKIYSNSK